MKTLTFGKMKVRLYLYPDEEKAVFLSLAKSI